MTVSITKCREKNKKKVKIGTALNSSVVTHKELQFSSSLWINYHRWNSSNSSQWVLTSLMFESVICPCLLINLISLSLMLGGNVLISPVYLEKFFIKYLTHLKYRKVTQSKKASHIRNKTINPKAGPHWVQLFHTATRYSNSLISNSYLGNSDALG